MRGFAAVGLHNAKNSLNVGGALRACGCYGTAMMAVDGRARNYMKPAATDTMKQFHHMPLLVCDSLYDVIPYSCQPVAVEIVEGAIPLQKYQHPQSAFYIFGPEDGSISDDVLDWCVDTVYVPTSQCMNLAATVNVVLYDRMVKTGGLA
jgi:tRNA(Leu) C34 or U34 (ribose-2'-O)-methylase TrmL